MTEGGSGSEIFFNQKIMPKSVYEFSVKDVFLIRNYLHITLNNVQAIFVEGKNTIIYVQVKLNMLQEFLIKEDIYMLFTSEHTCLCTCNFPFTQY
jgi:hypothetical protein